MTIYWGTFTWDAFATLTTGILAVGGAVLVGLRQIDISRRQTEIAERQADIQATLSDIETIRLRSEMFDRRMEVYRSVHEWLGWYFFHGSLPRLTYDSDDDKPIEEETRLARRFVQARELAPFIFRPEVGGFIEELAQLNRQLNRAKRNLKRIDKTGRAGGAVKAQQEEREAEDAIEAADRRKTAIFAPEMRLGEVLRGTNPHDQRGSH